MRRRDIVKGGLALLAAAPASGCASLIDLFRTVVKDPEVQVTGMRVTSMRLDVVETLFDVHLRNPNPVGFRLDGIGYALSVEGSRLARGDHQERLTLPAEGTARATLPVEVSLGRTAEAILKLLDKDEAAYALEAVLRFDWQRGTLEVPLTFEGKLPLPDVPEVRVQSVRFTSVSPRGLGVRVVTTVRNPNAFEIPIDRFRFDVTLNGHRVVRQQNVSGVRLKPRQTRDVRLEFTIGLVEAGLTAMSLVERPRLGWKVDAEVVSGKLALPFSASGRVKLG